MDYLLRKDSWNNEKGKINLVTLKRDMKSKQMQVKYLKLSLQMVIFYHDAK